MTIDRRFLLIAALPVLLASLQMGRAGDAASWDGAWSGQLGDSDPWPIVVTIAHGKVASYTEKGAPFDIQFSKVTPTTVFFGDRDHYSVKLVRTGDTTAAARIHGRIGYGHFALTKG